jgi:hypothetical protein
MANKVPPTHITGVILSTTGLDGKTVETTIKAETLTAGSRLRLKQGSNDVLIVPSDLELVFTQAKELLAKKRLVNATS